SLVEMLPFFTWFVVICCSPCPVSGSAFSSFRRLQRRELDIADVGACRDLGLIPQLGNREVLENLRGDRLELNEACNRHPTNLRVGMLGRPHGNEVSPAAEVAGHDEAGLRRVRQDSTCRLSGLLGPQRSIHPRARSLVELLVE